jgi:hypothetical protein
MQFPISLALSAGLILVGCQSERTAETATPSTPTPWPTLASLVTTQMSTSGEHITLGPQLIDKFRVNVQDGTMSLFPIEGYLDRPVRIEVLLEGDSIRYCLKRCFSHRLASANSGGLPTRSWTILLSG